MDITKPYKSRSILSKVTAINKEINRGNIKENICLKEECTNEQDTSESDVENGYSMRDSIVYKEEIEDIMMDGTSNKNKFSFRDQIVFKEELPMNTIYNNVNPDKKLNDAEMLDDEFQENCINTSVIKTELENSSEDDTMSGPQSFKNLIVFKEDLEDLYAEHTFKEEIIAGPVVFQGNADQQNGIFIDKSIAKVKVIKLNKNKHKQIYTCKCGKFYTNKKSFDKHICHTEFVCDYCGKIFNMKYKISIHIKRIHNQLPYDQSKKMTLEKHIEMYKNPQVNQEPKECDVCHKVILYNNLKRHQNIHLGIVHKCDKCDQTYKTKAGLQQHKVTHLDTDIKLCILCIYCSKEFNNKIYCNRHQRFCLNNPDKPRMQCDICQKTYPRRQSMIDHIMLHMDKPKKAYKRQNVQCDYCHKKFTKKYSLRLHIETSHMIVNRFFCKNCNRGFNRKYRLTSHEKNCRNILSNDSQPGSSKWNDSNYKFGCDLCLRKYKTRSGLKFHKESKHLNVKDHICKNCHVHFARKWTLNCHEKKCLTQNVSN